MSLLIHVLGPGFAVRGGAVFGAAVPAGGPAVGGPQPGELRGGVGGLPRVRGQSQAAAGQVGMHRMYTDQQIIFPLIIISYLMVLF